MWNEILQKRLTLYHQANLFRQRGELTSAQGVDVIYNGVKCISFCSNDYLGMANHPEVVQALQQAAAKYGVGSGASHLISGHSQIHRELEVAFAKFTGCDRALLFSSGYSANLGVIKALVDKDGIIFADKRNHASLLDGCQLSGALLKRYTHLDCNHLKVLMKHPSKKKLIITDGVFSMNGDIAPLPELVDISQQQQALLILDDAHGIGILGRNGGGCIEHFSIRQERISLLICPLGKSFGTFGALVAGSDLLIENLIQFARTFIYSTAIPAALAAASLVSLHLIRQEAWREKN